MKKINPEFEPPDIPRPLEIRFIFSPTSSVHGAHSFVKLIATVAVSGQPAYTSHVADIPIDMSPVTSVLPCDHVCDSNWIVQTLQHISTSVSTLDDLFTVVVGLRLRQVPRLVAGDWFTDCNELTTTAKNFIMNIWMLNQAFNQILNHT